MNKDNNLPEELRNAQPTAEEEAANLLDREQEVLQQLANLEQQQHNDAVIQNDLLGNGPTLLGMSLRPITLATLALLQQLDSDLLKGKAIEDCDNILLDCCRFVRMQTLPLKEATHLVRNRAAMDDAALALADKVPPYELESFVGLVTTALHSSMDNKVEPVPDAANTAEEAPQGMLGEG
jgi:hypothetical protein